ARGGRGSRGSRFNSDTRPCSSPVRAAARRQATLGVIVIMEIKSLASGSSGNCYWVTDGRSHLLIECGIPIKQIRRGVNYGLSYFAACLISHSHKDHCHAAQDLIDAGIPVYASKETWAEIGWRGQPWCYQLVPMEVYKVGTWMIQGFPLEHDAPGNLGFVCDSVVEGPTPSTLCTEERLVYISDTAHCPYQFPHTTHWMLEANYDPQMLQAGPRHKGRPVQTHMSIQSCCRILQKNDLSFTQEIWLLHLSDTNADAAAFKAMVQKQTGKRVFVAGGIPHD
ncbi:MAG: MBL fold metallo-hydrolase, partial [Methanotrichaceae archaeon]|nr:MBL fold metallo-hydrolase [Methanotrichaceae archaeon]